MIPVVLNSQNCWLLPYFPNSEGKVRLGATLAVDTKRALTGPTSRRPQALTPHYSLEWTSTIPAAHYAALRNATLAGQDEPILVPLWPHAIRIGIDSATVAPGNVVAWNDDFSSFAVNPGSLAGRTYLAPLLFGRIKAPRVVAMNDDYVTCDFSFDEDGPAAYSITPFTPSGDVITPALANGGFETAGAGGGDVFANWTEAVTGSGGFAQDTGTKNSGAKSARFTSSGTSAAGTLTQQIVVGRKYRLQMWTSGRGVAALDGAVSLIAADLVTGLHGPVEFVATTTNLNCSFSPGIGQSSYLDDVTLTDITPGALGPDTTFNTAGGFAAPIFPFVPEYTKLPVPGLAAVDVDRTAIGPGRIKATTFYPQTPEMVHQATFRFRTVSETAKFLSWWVRRAATTDPQWVACSQKLGFLAHDLAAGDTEIDFTKDFAVFPPANAYLALFAATGQPEIAQILLSTSTAIVTVAPFVNAWKANGTTVALAILARQTDKELVIEYTQAGNAWLSASTLSWREVSPEYSLPAGETRGTTIGALPPTAWFFQIDLDYHGAIASTYLTNWEGGDAIANSQTWKYNPSDFDKLIASDDLEDDNCNFSLRWFAGCPWENWLPGQLAARGFLTIFKADVARTTGAFSNFRQVWKGELSTPQLDGPNLKVTVLGANALFARSAPRQLMSTSCGTNLFSTRCGLLLTDWTWSGVIVSIAANVVTIGTLARSNGAGNPSGFGAVDWFALGWLGWTAGGLPMRASVLSSTVIGSGQISLTLDRAIALAGGTAITAVPGCDRTYATCVSKFVNGPNFRGFPLMPSVSPSFIIPQKDEASAKK